MYHLLTGRLPFQASEQLQPDLPDHQRRAAAAVGASARRSRRRSTRSCSARWRRTSSRRYERWDEFSLELAEVFRSEQIRRAQGAGVRRFRQVRDAARAAVLRASSPTPSCGRWRASRLAPRARRRGADPEGEPGDFFCILAAGRGQGHQARQAAQHAARRRVLRRDGLPLEAASTRAAPTSPWSADASIISVPTHKLAQASEACRHKFDRAFMAILVERLTMANLRLSGV